MSELNSEQITFDTDENKPNLKGILEGLLFIVGDDGLTAGQASSSTECSEEECEKILDELMKEYAADDSRGIEIANYGGVYRFLSKEYVIDSAKRLFQLNKQATLSPAAMETLAIIAYKQPITRVEIEEILAKASPLNPIEYVFSKSSTFLILLVACLSSDKGMSSAEIPLPLSTILIKDFPPFLISIIMLVAPASIEFSTSSFTTLAGLSITSPAAILLIVKSSNNTMLPIFSSLLIWGRSFF